MRALGLAVLVASLAGACGSPREEPPSEAPVSTGNDPIEVELLGRTARVRCEEHCTLVAEELDTLRDRCVADPTAVPGVLAIDGASLRQWGCCHEAERAYTTACEGGPTACPSEWLARCEHAALSSHAAHGGGAPGDEHAGEMPE
jgi:hypothetical protein